MVKVGDVLVARTDVPRRFRNVKAGTFWKVVEVRDTYGDRITVGDGDRPSVRTHARYFHVLDGQVRQTVVDNMEGTDLGYRMEAIEGFRSELKNVPVPCGTVKVTVNGVTSYVEKTIAKALASSNPSKLAQKKLAAAAGGI